MLPEENKEEPKTLKEEILDKLSTLITAAFGLVAALAWNEFMKTAFKQFFGEANTLLPMLSYAITVTIIAVILIFVVARGIAKLKGEKTHT